MATSCTPTPYTSATCGYEARVNHAVAASAHLVAAFLIKGDL